MPLRNARRLISKFKPSIAIMKEIPQRFPSLLQQVQITKSVWYSKTKVIFQDISFIPKRKNILEDISYLSRRKNILEDKNYILRQKLYFKTKVYIPEKKDSCQFNSCRNSAHAVLTLSQDLLSREFLRTSSFQLPKTMNLPYWWNENLEFFELLFMFSPRISYKP